jgi:hypothetical protein
MPIRKKKVALVSAIRAREPKAPYLVPVGSPQRSSDPLLLHQKIPIKKTLWFTHYAGIQGKYGFGAQLEFKKSVSLKTFSSGSTGHGIWVPRFRTELLGGVVETREDLDSNQRDR